MTRHDSFQDRHIGPRPEETAEMLKTVGASSLEELIDQTIPQSIRLNRELNLPAGLSEYEYSRHINELGSKNKAYTNFIGQGYYGTIIPAPIQRNVLENPGWYTAYTPYQAEISQGRLQALLNFQTVVSDLCGLPIANASLLDEGTAAAEGALMLYHSMSRAKAKTGANKFFIDEKCFTQTIEVVKAKAEASGIYVEVGNAFNAEFDASYFGVLLQYPDKTGEVRDYRTVVDLAHQHEVKIVVASDLMALTLLTPPGEWGADVVVGSAQRFGVPMGFGGPHAGFFATKEDYKRNIPGRIIGVSVDRSGRQALRMALQTREQHIRRDKATSNICTAQALLAVMASMYAVYHGPDRLKSIATEIGSKAKSLADTLSMYGVSISNESYFDTFNVKGIDAEQLKAAAESHSCNFWYHEDGSVSISIDETTRLDDLNLASRIFAEATGNDFQTVDLKSELSIANTFHRISEFLTHPNFNSYHSETDFMRYIKSLENKDISLTRSMISLGSCTMKLNAASELYPITNPAFSNVHPFVPLDQAAGYVEMINELESSLAEITGFDRVSFQPNSGAQGEYAGLMVIRAFHEAMGNGHRNIVLIPSSAHGTNPASAVVAGMKVVVVKCDEKGNIDVPDLKAKAEEHSENLGALMVTYPSTHGVFEEAIQEITQIVHDNGGQVYMDGANMNAQVGLTNPATIGADVCHLNLHKTFAIPHGGGGPGVGPIGVAKHLSPYLPGHPFTKTGGEQGIGPVSSAPFGSSLILLISYAYVKMLGAKGLTDSTRFAILNANYLKERLKDHFPVLYTAENGRVAHEMILDCRPFKKSAQIEVTDIAKRLIDFGFHAPTVSFPVAGTIMVEPTESESQAELDRFVDALVEIRNEIDKIESGERLVEESALRNAPHTADVLLTESWDRPYSREEGAFPVNWARDGKYWVPVSRIDDAYGDRNLICACPPIEEYAEA